MNKIITRFAPSPTGLLHIGSARTALFNWLYSKKHKGKFLLRIEDTDLERSTQKSIDTIIKGLKWLGINWDEYIIYQSKNKQRHQEIAKTLIKSGHAYYCYATKKEIEEFKNKNPNKKFVSNWRENTSTEPIHNNYVVRLKINHLIKTTLQDQILGEIVIDNKELDDLILLRSDGTPTYMLAVVVDDHDMGINNVIRGDDHLTNTFKQINIYKALNWPIPNFSHIPLIHGKDGGKLSKRHGALGVQSYKDMGYLPEAMCNYLLRLGWGHKNIEIIDMQTATEIFELSDIGKSPAKFDIDKLNSINAHYISIKSNEELIKLLPNFIKVNLSNSELKRISNGLNIIKQRASTIKELADYSMLFIKKQHPKDDKSTSIISDENNLKLLKESISLLEIITDWNADEIKKAFADFAKINEIKLPKIMQILRAGAIGTFSSPGIFDMIEILGKDEVLTRIKEEI